MEAVSREDAWMRRRVAASSLLCCLPAELYAADPCCLPVLVLVIAGAVWLLSEIPLSLGLWVPCAQARQPVALLISKFGLSRGPNRAPS